MHKLSWNCIAFDDLTPDQLYDILQLRTEVFVVEQKCLYQDMDDQDRHAVHVLGILDDQLLCYSRLLVPGSQYPEPAMGRVITALSVRRQGYGKILLEESLSYCQNLWPDIGVRISAQQHLESFYQAFDFIKVSKPYLEDGIPHIEMLRSK